MAAAAWILLLVTVASTAPPVVGQTQAGTPSVPPSSAQELANKSLACLDRGEDILADESRMPQYREGLAYAKQALALDDRNADAHFGLFANQARIMAAEGIATNPFNLFTIQRELSRVLELDPNHPDGVAAKGEMLMRLPRLLGGSTREAVIYLRRAIEIDPNAVRPRIELGKAYVELGETQRARVTFEEAAVIAERGGKLSQLERIRTELGHLASP